MTSRDKKDSVRGCMAYAGEPFNIAHRKVEAAAAGHLPKPELLVRRTGRCDLSNRELAALPPEIAQLANLSDLRLDGSQLTALPKRAEGPPPAPEKMPLTCGDCGGVHVWR